MGKPIRWCSVSDTHGDQIDPGALKAFKEFVRFFKPTIRIHHGDVFDFRALRNGASEAERQESMEADVDAGLDFLKWYKPGVILRGNHDERLWEAAAESRNGNTRDLCTRLIREIEEQTPGVRWFPYHKRHGIYRLGHLKVIHGYHNGVMAAKQSALIYGSVILGHGHAIDQFSIPGLERRIGRMSGALCRLDMPYNARQPNTLRQAHGWAYGLLYPSGSYVVWQAEQEEGVWCFPSEIKEVRVAA